jgi:sigma-B regulation protein RsbU (phosphoserine phosphatase)
VASVSRPLSPLKSLFLLNRAAQRLNSILDLQQLLDTVVDDVALTFRCNHTYICLKECRSDDLVIAALRGGHRGKGDRVRIGRDGMVGQAALHRKIYYAPDVRLNPHYIGYEESIRSELDVPILCHRGELLGVVSLQRKEVDGFTSSDIKILKELVEHLSVAIRNSNLFQEERSALNHLELAEQEARQVQQFMFPKHAPEIDGYRIDGICVPAERTSGDWFDYVPLRDGKWGVMIADAAGKGMAAALLMSTARAVLRIMAPIVDSPSELMTQVNTQLLTDTPDGKYVTMAYGVLDPRENTWTFTNAGHPEMLFIQADLWLPHQSDRCAARTHAQCL